ARPRSTNSGATKWQPVWRYQRKIFRNLPRRSAVPLGSYFPKKLCDARCDWIMSCCSQTSISNFSAGTNCCSRSEMGILSRFFLRAGSSRWRRRESRMKNISCFACAKANDIIVPFILTARQMNFHRRHGTSHSALGWMNMTARLWLVCGSRACAQQNRFDGGKFELHDQRIDKSRGTNLDSAPASARAATARLSDCGRSADAFSATSRGSHRVPAFSERRKRCSHLSLRRGDQNFAAPVWRVEENFRSNVARIATQCAE